MTDPSAPSVAAEAGLSPSLSASLSSSSPPPLASAAAGRGQAQESEAVLRILAHELSRNLSRITSCARQKELRRQARLLDLAFHLLMAQGFKAHSNSPARFHMALQSQQVFLKLVQRLEAHEQKIKENELIRDKRPRRRKQGEIR